ncbi:hypothetical protein BD626DRAFT_509304, partial [Schizophyllum amplum]
MEATTVEACDVGRQTRQCREASDCESGQLSKPLTVVRRIVRGQDPASNRDSTVDSWNREARPHWQPVRGKVG